MRSRFTTTAAYFGLSLTVGLILAACRSLSTAHVDPQSGATINGMLYYLPIGKITIKGEFEEVASESAKPNPSVTSKSDAAKTAEEKAGKPNGTDGSDQSGTPSAGSGETTIGVTQLIITLTPEEEADGSAGTHYVTRVPNYLYEDEVKL